MNFISELNELADGLQYHQPIKIDNYCSRELLISKLKDMLTIRIVEEEIAKLVENKIVKCPCHLGVGQEAIAVGVSSQLRKTDRVFGTHRSHSHYLALGGSVHQLFAEVLGKVTGCAKGMGGSMHLIDQPNGFLGSVPIVGATIPLAVGAALAAKMDKKNDVAVCFFGDGAAEEGVLHESLNLASAQKLPVLFVCENNLYSSHLDIKFRQPSDRVARFAEAHHIPTKVVEGNDVIAVEKAAIELLVNMREKNYPGFLEVITYRWRGHVGPNEDIDVGVRRNKKTLENWKKRDPIGRLVKGMIHEGLLSEDEFNEINQAVRHFILEQKDRALSDPYPQETALNTCVYAD